MEDIQNLCVYAIGFIFILFFISEYNLPNVFEQFIFTDLGLIFLLVMVILLFSMYNPLIIFLGCLVLLVLLSKMSVKDIIDRDVKHKEMKEKVFSNKHFESPSLDSCGDLSQCKKMDNLEVTTVQSMLPYVDDTVVDSKPSWKPVLCKPIVD